MLYGGCHLDLPGTLPQMDIFSLEVGDVLLGSIKELELGLVEECGFRGIWKPSTITVLDVENRANVLLYSDEAIDTSTRSVRITAWRASGSSLRSSLSLSEAGSERQPLVAPPSGRGNDVRLSTETADLAEASTSGDSTSQPAHGIVAGAESAVLPDATDDAGSASAASQSGTASSEEAQQDSEASDIGSDSVVGADVADTLESSAAANVAAMDDASTADTAVYVEPNSPDTNATSCYEEEDNFRSSSEASSSQLAGTRSASRASSVVDSTDCSTAEEGESSPVLPADIKQLEAEAAAPAFDAPQMEACAPVAESVPDADTGAAAESDTELSPEMYMAAGQALLERKTEEISQAELRLSYIHQKLQQVRCCADLNPIPVTTPVNGQLI